MAERKENPQEKYEEKLLTRLVEGYRRSRKDTGTNTIRRRTQCEPAKLYRAYCQNDGSPEEIEAVNRTAAVCRDKGFVTFEMRGFSNEIARIYLVDERVEEIEEYLSGRYGYEPKQKKRRQAEALAARYENGGPAARLLCGRIRQALERNRLPRDIGQAEDELKALAFLEDNREDLYLREASMLIYGSSKYLEETVLEGVCQLLREAGGRLCGEGELVDEILEDYHVRRERRKLCLRGNLTLQLSGQTLALGAFQEGIEFFAAELPRISQVTVHDRAFMTVENRTSYLRIRRPDTCFFYLGGYADRDQRDFLRMVYRDNPQLSYLHFGDIDAGGFYICEDLRRKSGIPFSPYRMSVAELSDERFRSCLRPLSKTDRRNLASLAGQERYRETAEYMLQQGVKLEQEIVSYTEG